MVDTLVGTKRIDARKVFAGPYLEQDSNHSNTAMLALVLFTQANVFSTTSKAGLKQRRACSF
jgi:hypothetical protein